MKKIIDQVFIDIPQQKKSLKAAEKKTWDSDFLPREIREQQSQPCERSHSSQLAWRWS